MNYIECLQIKYCWIFEMIHFINFNLIELHKEDNFFELTKHV